MAIGKKTDAAWIFKAMNIFKNNFDLLSFVSIILSIFLIFSSLGVVIDAETYREIFSYDKNTPGILFSFQSLIAGILALAAGLCVLLNTYYKHQIDRKRANSFVTQTVKYFLLSCITYVHQINLSVKNDVSVEVMCSDLGNLVIPNIFIENIRYASYDQQIRCFYIVDRIRNIREMSAFINNHKLDHSSTEIIVRLLVEIINVAKVFLAHEGVSSSEEISLNKFVLEMPTL